MGNIYEFNEVMNTRHREGCIFLTWHDDLKLVSQGGMILLFSHFQIHETNWKKKSRVVKQILEEEPDDFYKSLVC